MHGARRARPIPRSRMARPRSERGQATARVRMGQRRPRAVDQKTGRSWSRRPRRRPGDTPRVRRDRDPQRVVDEPHELAVEEFLQPRWSREATGPPLPRVRAATSSRRTPPRRLRRRRFPASRARRVGQGRSYERREAPLEIGGALREPLDHLHRDVGTLETHRAEGGAIETQQAASVAATARAPRRVPAANRSRRRNHPGRGARPVSTRHRGSRRAAAPHREQHVEGVGRLPDSKIDSPPARRARSRGARRAPFRQVRRCRSGERSGVHGVRFDRCERTLEARLRDQGSRWPASATAASRRRGRSRQMQRVDAALGSTTASAGKPGAP